AISKISCEGTRDSAKRLHRMRSEWKMAKIALIVILLFVISWAPYSCTALTAFAGALEEESRCSTNSLSSHPLLLPRACAAAAARYADLLTPYMNSVPAVIAKSSAIYNPIVYAITHPKYRSALGRYVPYLGALLCMSARERLSSSSFQSTRRSTLTSQSDGRSHARPRHSSESE
ncbi:unnamed protein product, partial [Tetraodon nigroviridis]